MADESVTATGDGGKGRHFDFMLGVHPDGWNRMNAEEKAVLALTPFFSLAQILEGGGACYDVSNLDACRVLKALVDRAELLLGIPGQSVIGCVKDDGGNNL